MAASATADLSVTTAIMPDTTDHESDLTHLALVEREPSAHADERAPDLVQIRIESG
jgi:hypothetical protein